MGSPGLLVTRRGAHLHGLVLLPDDYQFSSVREIILRASSISAWLIRGRPRNDAQSARPLYRVSRRQSSGNTPPAPRYPSATASSKPGSSPSGGRSRLPRSLIGEPLKANSPSITAAAPPPPSSIWTRMLYP